jgi:hypothetical protein
LTDAVPDVVPAGAVAVIKLLLTNVKDVAASPPTVTAVAPVNAVPVIVSRVPPVSGPLAGETIVTVGTDNGTTVNVTVPALPLVAALVTAATLMLTYEEPPVVR